MPEYEPKKILSHLEYAIKKENLECPLPMCGDKWLVSSAMQKGIRFGEVERATRAAVALWQQDRQNFWRRIHIASLEDCAGSPDVVVQVLTATASSTWRRQMGDLRVGLYLTRLLCDAVKSRAADELFLCVERAKEHADMRQRFSKADDALLTAYAADPEECLVTRSLSLWFLAGTAKYTSDYLPLRKGSPEEAIKVLRSLAVPTDLVESCIGVMNRTQWPLAIFTPLIWQEVQKQQVTIRQHDISPCPDVDGIPLYAADMFTRTGQSCFRQFQKVVPELQWFNPKQIGLGVFYSEGGRLNKSLTSPFLEELRQAGEAADMESVGLDVPEYLGLKDCVIRHAPILESIRKEQLQRYLNGVEA